MTDDHPVHKTKKMKAWLKDNKMRIEVLFISPYSPELNAQEYLNQDVKTNVIGKKRPINKEQMKDNVNQFMNVRKKNKSRCKSMVGSEYLRHKWQYQDRILVHKSSWKSIKI